MGRQAGSVVPDGRHYYCEILDGTWALRSTSEILKGTSQSHDEPTKDCCSRRQSSLGTSLPDHPNLKEIGSGDRTLLIPMGGFAGCRSVSFPAGIFQIDSDGRINKL